MEGPKDEKNHDDKYAEAEAQEKEEGDEETTANTKAVEASKRQRPRYLTCNAAPGTKCSVVVATTKRQQEF